MGTVQDAKGRKEEFYSVYKSLSGEAFPDQNLELLIQAFSHLGITIPDLFAEDDSSKLRLYLSELVMKRQICGIESSAEYGAACMTLLLYIEYLEHPDIVPSQTEIPANRNKTMDSLTVAYYLSRFDKNALRELDYVRFNAAFEDLGKKLQQKPATLKNMRDEFDPYFDNGRKGWYQKPLAGTRKEIFTKYADTSFGKMTAIVKGIIAAYIGKKEDAKEDGHRKIKISSSNMKEINSKRRK